jgi:anti-sigma factor RsiW
LNCKGVIQELNDHLDGNLDSSLAKELESHLEHCEDCRVVVDTTKKTVDILCDAEPAELPNGVQDRLQSALAKKIKGQS